MDNSRIKHLEMIQVIIERMARNSFLYKGWALSIFAALFVLTTPTCFLIVLLQTAPLLGFWGLDAYYLRQERLFRKLYDFVRVGKDEADFSMNTGKINSVDNWLKVCKSATILWFYLPMVIIVIFKSVF